MHGLVWFGVMVLVVHFIFCSFLVCLFCFFFYLRVFKFFLCTHAFYEFHCCYELEFFCGLEFLCFCVIFLVTDSQCSSQ
jgi:hypothetical protein